ncbi:DMT family transporter [Elstera litoralis]|nr:DMT family transporter [Elstera litoralis]
MASLCWTLGPLIATPVIKEIGSVAFSRSRMVIFVVLLGAAASLFADWSHLTWDASFWAVLSGLIGLSLGDVALFQCYKMIGPRLGSLIYMSAAPFTVILGWALLGEACRCKRCSGGRWRSAALPWPSPEKKKKRRALRPNPAR